MEETQPEIIFAIYELLKTLEILAVWAVTTRQKRFAVHEATDGVFAGLDGGGELACGVGGCIVIVGATFQCRCQRENQKCYEEKDFHVGFHDKLCFMFVKIWFSI